MLRAVLSMADSLMDELYHFPIGNEMIGSANPHREDRLVIESCSRPPVQVVQNGLNHFARRSAAASPHDVRESPPPVLETLGVQVVGDPVGIEHQEIARSRLKYQFLVLAGIQK